MKVANFTKESLRNGAIVAGGHRVKYVSDDKEFIILVTSFGVYQGIYLTYEKDGAYIDTDRTPAPSEKIVFQNLDECKKFFKVGEYADETVKELTLTESTKTQDGMRKIVTDICISINITLDHVSIWQHNGNSDYGLAVAFNGKKPVAVAQWERTRTGKETTYTFVSDNADKYDALRKRI